MKMRRVTSITALLSFIILIITSVILYIVPFGRIAYWSDWTLMGLSKEQWGGIHINTGLLFLISMLLHLFFNWTPLVTYLKNRAGRVNFQNRESALALAITLVFTLGTYFNIPPLSTFLNLSESIKNRSIETYGEPPFGHAELSSLKTFSQKVKLDLTLAVKLLKENGIRFENTDQNLKEIAHANQISPQDLFNIIKPAKIEAVQPGLPEIPPAGLGRKSLENLCRDYGLDLERTLQKLEKTGIKAAPDTILKEIADGKGKTPFEMYNAIRASIR